MASKALCLHHSPSSVYPWSYYLHVLPVDASLVAAQMIYTLEWRNAGRCKELVEVSMSQKTTTFRPSYIEPAISVIVYAASPLPTSIRLDFVPLIQLLKGDSNNHLLRQ